MSLEFKIDKNKGGSVFDLPLFVRLVIYKDVMDLLSEIDDLGPDEDGNYSGYQSESLPLVYIPNKDNIVCLLYIVDEEHKYTGDILAMNLNIHDIDRLVEETQNE